MATLTEANEAASSEPPAILFVGVSARWPLAGATSDAARRAMRSTGLHRVLEGSPAWEVDSWGGTDRLASGELVELILELRSMPVKDEPATPLIGLLVKRLLSGGLQKDFVETVILLVARLRQEISEGRLDRCDIHFPHGDILPVEWPTDDPDRS